MDELDPTLKGHASESTPKNGAEPTGSHPEEWDDDPTLRRSNEDLDTWAKRFCAVMDARDREMERRRPKWHPLMLFGLTVR